jgi:hypothetical protein
MYDVYILKKEVFMLSNSQVQDIARKYTNSANEIEGFFTLWKFLNENIDFFGWRGKYKPNLTEVTGTSELAEKYFTSKLTKVSPSIPQTVPDEMVSVILKKFYKHPLEKLNNIKVEHQHSMAAENMVGELLERYIDSILSNYGWVWCCAALVKHVDFIKLENNEYRLLQIKNRDNSENSSSKAIRDGTTIEHWFRTFSRTGRTNWDAFPDTQLKSKLSEDGFIKFVENYN